MGEIPAVIAGEIVTVSGCAQIVGGDWAVLDALASATRRLKDYQIIRLPRTSDAERFVVRYNGC